MLTKLTDRVYYMPHNSETDRPIIGYIRGDRFSFMVDAGNSPEHVKLFYNELKKLGLREPDYVGITHWHWDHCYGMCAVNAVSIACNKTNEYLKKMSRWEWTDQAMKERIENGEDIEFCDIHIRKEYPDRDKIVVRTADLVFEEKLILDLGGITCKMIRIVGSHSEDSVVMFFPEDKILFVGDGVCGDIHHNGGNYYPDKLQKLIEELKSLDFEVCLMGHDKPWSRQEILEDLELELKNLT